MRAMWIAIVFLGGCATPPEPFCVTTSMSALCGDDARGNRYRPVCPAGTADAGGSPSPEPIAATCTRNVLDPCPDGSEPVCVPID